MSVDTSVDGVDGVESVSGECRGCRARAQQYSRGASYQTSIPVDKRFGVPMLETDKQRFLVMMNTFEDDDADDQFSIPSMINTKKRRTEETVRIQKECDERADQMMQNGVKVNPMLRQMFPGSVGSVGSTGGS